MSSFEKAEEQEILDALARQAEPMLASNSLAGWIIIEQPPDVTPKPNPPPSDFAPNVRHINRTRHGMQWLGPAITKPQYIRPEGA